jgi:N-acetylmuramoyl-L-alanine amidase
MSNLIAICVGHSRNGDQGAESVDGTSEHNFNSRLADAVKLKLTAMDIESVVVNHYEGEGYGGAMAWLAKHLAETGATAALELHFNCADSPNAHGYEYLHWHSSSRGKALAESLQTRHGDSYPADRDRGIVPINGADRGAGFLRGTPCSAVICEPFFGSNDMEWEQYSNDIGGLATVYALAIKDWIKG